MPIEPFLWVVGAVAVVIVFFAVLHYFERRRSNALSRVASDMGFSFGPDLYPVHEELSHLRLFQQGRRRETKNVLRGSLHGNKTTLFDYKFTVGYGKNSHDYHQTVAAFHSSEDSLPSFELRPEGILAKISSALGFYKDIDFEANPDFSKRYLLRGSDERAVRTLFHPGVLGFFREELGWAAEGGGNWLVIYRPAWLIKPGNLRSFLNTAERIFRLFSRS